MRARNLTPALAALWVAAAGGGCRMHADFSGSAYLCSDGESCPPGLACAADGVCREPGVDAVDAPAPPDIDATPPGDARADSAPPPDGAKPDAPAVDAAPPDAAPAGCDWSSGPTFGAVVHVDELNSSFYEVDVGLSVDGLTAYFSSNRTGSVGYSDLWWATRASAAAPFIVQGALVELNSAEDDGWARLATDGLEVFFHSRRSGNYDFYRATRASTTDAFSAPELVAELSTAEDEWDPNLMPDDLTIYFSGRGSPPLGDGRNHLLVARRPDRDSPFGTPQMVPGLPVYGAQDAGPAVSGDERLIVWHSQSRSGGEGSYDLWYSVRPDRSATFGTPLPLADLNTSAAEWKAYLRPDGCELWFTSDRSGGFGSNDFYRVEVLPP